MTLMSQTRVLHVLSGLNVGGMETIVMSLYQHVNRERIQFDFVLHTTGEQYYASLARKLGANIYIAPQPKKAGLLHYIRWWNQFYKEHPQYKIIHGHVPTYASIYLGIAKRYNCTTICHCHTAFPVVTGMTYLIRSVLHYPLRWMADYYFACSRAAGEYLFGKDVVKRSRFRVIPNARNTRLFAYSSSIRQQMRKKLGLTECIVVGHVGRMMEVKNQAFLLNIFAEIYKSNSHARLLLVGDGPLKEQLLRQTRQQGLTQAVLFMGNVDNPQDYYQVMDVFVFPSLYEGLGMTLIEAQIAGLPCVFSANLPTEVDLEVGLCHRVSLAEFAEKWAEIILAQAQVKRISHVQQAVDKGFEITTLANQLGKFYLELSK